MFFCSLAGSFLGSSAGADDVSGEDCVRMLGNQGNNDVRLRITALQQTPANRNTDSVSGGGMACDIEVSAFLFQNGKRET